MDIAFWYNLSYWNIPRPQSLQWVSAQEPCAYFWRLANPRHLQNIHHACDTTFQFVANGYSSAHALFFASTERKPSLGLRKRLIEAAVEDALVPFFGTRRQKPDKPINGRDARRPGFSDEQLWTKFAWRFGWGMLRVLTLQGMSK